MDTPVGKYGSALAAAAAQGYLGTVKLLLDHGADVYAETNLEYKNARDAAVKNKYFGIERCLRDWMHRHPRRN